MDHETQKGSVMAKAKAEIDPVTAAERAVRLCEHGLEDARARVNLLTREVREKRQRVAQEIQNWQAAFPQRTAADVQREFIAASQAEKRRLKENPQQATTGDRPGPSHVDRLAFGRYQGGPRSLDRGYGAGWRRGASTKKGARLKLPSERA
jgi:hypothetical protein